MKPHEIITESYSAYCLDKKSRRTLLSIFPPKFSIVLADHITVKYGLTKDDKMPNPASIEVVGYASDDGLEAAVVAVNGSTRRSDGKVYHITLSYNEGRKAVQSNGLLANGWTPVEPFSINTKPELLK